MDTLKHDFSKRRQNIFYTQTKFHNKHHKTKFFEQKNLVMLSTKSFRDGLNSYGGWSSGWSGGRLDFG